MKLMNFIHTNRTSVANWQNQEKNREMILPGITTGRDADGKDVGESFLIAFTISAVRSF